MRIKGLEWRVPFTIAVLVCALVARDRLRELLQALVALPLFLQHAHTHTHTHTYTHTRGVGEGKTVF